MKIAIPVANKQLCMHFGHCEQFYVYNVDMDNKTVGDVEKLTPPPHEPGVLPKWLKELGTDVIIAGGMGQGAQKLFLQYGIKVVVGASVQNPKETVEEYLKGKLSLGGNACDH